MVTQLLGLTVEVSSHIPERPEVSYTAHCSNAVTSTHHVSTQNKVKEK